MTRLPAMWVLAPVAFLVSAVSATVVSYVTPAPSRSMREFVRELRLPIGETIFDREQRYAQARRRRRRREGERS
ncbi:MAG: hypothetical protein AAFO79_09335 [Pseudomonadota bacterium]